MSQNSNPLVVEDSLIPRPLRIVKRRNQDTNGCRYPGAVGIRPESLYADLCYPGLPGILYVPKQRKVKSTSANSVTANTANPHLTRLKCRFSNEPSLLLPRSVPLNEACRNNSHVRSANPSSLAYPSPLNQRRAFTMENPRRKLEKAPTQRNISNTDNPGRKASIKQRFSLIMSSFTGSPKSKSPSLTSMDPQDTATNPNPPVLTGEPLITGTPLNSANVEWPSQTLHTPKSVSILRPEISIILHRDFLESDGKENVLVALEVNAACGNKKTQEPLVVVSLDIVVIIDNSPFASPATLMASFEATRFLTLLLDPLKDRLAILCTNSFDSEDPDARILLPLEPPIPRNSKRAVDSIVNATNFSNSRGVYSAAQRARSLLERSVSRRPESGPVTLASGHILVFSPNPEGFSKDILDHDKIQLHLINFGAVPWKSENRVRANGWRLQSMLTEQLSLENCVNDTDPFSISNELRSLVGDARQGVLHGKITGLSLAVEPASHYHVEKIHQNNRIASISPGEKIVVALLRLRGGPKTKEELQDKGLTTVLSAELGFKHSLLPNSRCMVTAKGQLSGGRSSLDDDSNHEITVHKLLMFHIATHQSPRQAIQSLIGEFGNEGVQSACPEYFGLVVKELLYQVHLIERFGLRDFRSPATRAVPRCVQSERHDQELRPRPLFVEGHTRPRSTFYRPSTTNELALAMPPAALRPTPVTNSWIETPRPDSPVLNDHLQKLWRDPGRVSRRPLPRVTSGNNENVRPGSVRHALEELVELAELAE